LFRAFLKRSEDNLMKTLGKPILFAFAVSILAACGGGGGSSPPPAGPAAPVVPAGALSAAATVAPLAAFRFGDRKRIYLTVRESTSPLSRVASEDDVRTYNTAGVRITPTITEGLNNPGALAVDSTGKLYVANGNNTITTYDSNGRRTRLTIHTSGALAIGPDNKLYVLNIPASRQGTLTTYSSDGRQINPTIKGLNNVWGFTVDAAGKIYIASGYVTNVIGTYGNVALGAVTIYNADGRHPTPTIKTTGSGDAGIALGVAVDNATGNIYVLLTGVGGDSGANTGAVYTANGTPTTLPFGGGCSVVIDDGKVYTTTCYEDAMLNTYTLTGAPSSPHIDVGLQRIWNILGTAVH
jgi:hypothetical protein